jgi:protein kinase C and casein kinase substrate in neurons protein
MLTAKLKYSSALLDLKAINGSYMENMAEVFERTQAFEQRRIDFNKMILTELHNALDLSKNSL